MDTKNRRRALVTGAGGFIGHHLVSHLKRIDYWVRGVDLKEPAYESSKADEFRCLDLRIAADCAAAVEGVDEVYALAADMGGMGFISTNHARILHNNSLINIHTIEAARTAQVKKVFFASSACVYPLFKQTSEAVIALKEEDAYPAQPEDAYGWEKLVSERLFTHYHDDHGLETRIARFHNIFGPLGTWTGGREKAPAAVSRKIALAKLRNQREIEIWGDGKQTRSFCYVDDCISGGIMALMGSDHHMPINIGQDRLISINDLVRIVSAVSGHDVTVKHVPGPQGVRGRNSDNSRVRQVLGWTPSVTLEEGMRKTYLWVEAQVKEHLESGEKL